MKTTQIFDNVTIILVEPQGPQNIGSVCRAMKSMGFYQLKLVRPRSLFLKDIKTMACGTEDIFYGAEIHQSLPDAIEGLNWIIGTTGRKRNNQTLTPLHEISQEIYEHIPEQKIGILFGREDWGLSNEDLDYCQRLCIIPTTQFHSINLAQSVLLTCYDLKRLHHSTLKETQIEWADQAEIQLMIKDWRQLLDETEYFNRGTPEGLIRSIKHMGDRARFRKREVRILHGICSHLNKIIHQK